MSEYQQIENLFYDLTVQMRQFGNCAVKLNDYQQRIEASNLNLERLILSMSASKDILSFDNNISKDNVIIQQSDSNLAPVEEKQPILVQQPSKVNTSVLSKTTSQKRPRATLFSLEKQKGNIPKKFQNTKDISTLEHILQFIASKKKDGVLLKDVYVLINESTGKCNDYLNVLVKLEEVVKEHTKKGFVFSLHPVRYHKYLNS